MVQVSIQTGEPSETSAGLLAVGLYKDEAPPESIGSVAEPAISDGDFTGKSGETALLYTNGFLPSPRLLLIGLGEGSSFTLEKLRRAAASVARKAWSLKAESVAFVPKTPEGSGVEGVARAASEGAALGLYRFDRYKTGDENSDADEEYLGNFEVVLSSAGDEEAAGRGVREGESLSAAAILARDLANEPSNTATPEYLAERAREISERHGMGLTVLDRAGIESEGLTGLATVGRSATNEPRFIVLEHRKGGDEAAVVLVGKAVTFDSGRHLHKTHWRHARHEIRHGRRGGVCSARWRLSEGWTSP